MEAIKLTKRSITQLKEMIKNLFPEYDYCDIVEETVIIGKKQSEDEFFINFKEPIIKIHWFEFCMVHLAPKVFNPWHSGQYTPRTVKEKEEYYYCTICTKTAHPVASLYSRFKKLILSIKSRYLIKWKELDCIEENHFYVDRTEVKDCTTEELNQFIKSKERVDVSILIPNLDATSTSKNTIEPVTTGGLIQ